MSGITISVKRDHDIIVTGEDAIKYTIKFLRHPPQTMLPKYGYDLYLDTMLTVWLHEQFNIDSFNGQTIKQKISPIFIDACWELCRRGILRPFTRDINGQSTSQGAGFSITAFGHQWLLEDDMDDFVPTEPDRFAEMLKPYTAIFGDGFHERSQEAVRCYNAHAYLACCSMAGAAAETILIKIADKLLINRTKNMPITKIKDAIISKSAGGVQEGLIAYSEIVKYWRDEGMHHENWETRGEKAYISLAMLLRLAIFAKDKWFSATE